MHKLTNKQYEAYMKMLRDKEEGQLLTPDGLRMICAANEYDPEKPTYRDSYADSVGELEQGGGMKEYIHFGHDHFDREIFQEIKNEAYFCKPKGGLWASPVNAEYGWKDWCEAENFRECSQDNSFVFELKDGAKVYHIRHVSDVKAMPLIDNGITTWHTLDFEKMLADGWDAIELHLSECGELYWALYGWDCDCILVMNPDIVEV